MTTTLDETKSKTQAETKVETAAATEASDAKAIVAGLADKEKAKQARAEKKELQREAKKAKPSRVRSALTNFFLPERKGVPIIVWSVLLHGAVLLAFYLLAVVTAQGVIPALGLWLHQESGAAMGTLNSDGTLAMWIMPLLFMVALLVAGEIAVMRAMWRWADRMVQKIRDRRAARDEDVAGATAPVSKTTTRQSKKNRKRSK